MEKVLNPFFILYFILAMAWIYRARRALDSMNVIPTVRPEPFNPGTRQPPVTVIIPARNEERNIRDCVSAFLAQDYPNLQIIVVNDHSTDQTESILQSMGVVQISDDSKDTPAGSAKAVYFNNPQTTPPGWTGKNFALHMAVPKARGSWLLFTDADTRHEPSSVSASVAYAQNRDLEYMTLLPRCLTGSFLERVIQPTAMLFLGLWFPMEKINQPETEATFGNGQYLLIRRSLYQKIGGHEQVAGEFLEDYAITRLVKKAGARYLCALGVPLYGTRMYDSFGSMWNGWRRIYLHAFEKKAWKIIVKFLTVLAISVMPYIIFVPFTPMAMEYPKALGFAWGFAIVTLLFIIATCWKAYGIIKANRLFAFFHPIAAFFVALFLLDAASLAWQKKETSWR